MHRSFKRFLAGILHNWRRIKYPVGYSLFAVALGYGMWHAPAELWQLSPGWLTASLGIVVVMFQLQLWQLNLFLRSHGAESGWLYPALFNARRGILNTLFPARTGTLLLLHSLKQKYSIRWPEFLHFFLLSGAISLYASGLALVWLLWPWGYSVLLLVSSLLLSIYIAHRARFRYADCVPGLLLLAVALYASTAAVFFCLLRGLGYSLSLTQVSYFAVVLNVLAQVSVTPGNIGVREVAMGLIAPFVTLPMAVGIIASSLLLVLRLLTYGVFWGGLEWLYRQKAQVSE